MKIRDHIEFYFLDLFIDHWPIRQEVEGVSFEKLNENQHDWLERPFSKEIKATLNSLSNDKAPELDRFPTKLLKMFFWMWGGRKPLLRVLLFKRMINGVEV